MFRILAVVLAFLAMTPASGQEHQEGGLRITDAVIYKTFARARALAGYMQIENTGDVDDALVGARSDRFDAMLHESRDQDGVLVMIHRDAIAIPAGQKVSFAPGSYHVMITGLVPGDLEIGDALDVTLVFERAGEIPAVFNVEPFPKSVQTRERD